MTLLAAFLEGTLSVVFVFLAIAISYTAWEARRITARYPNLGEQIDVGGTKLNSLLLPASEGADLPPLIFIHGASGNLRDLLCAFGNQLKGRADLLFIDRPGHGYSERGGKRSLTPDGQADLIAGLMEKRGIEKAIVIGHSFGGAITASLALRHPEKVAGLVFLAPATHPWPGGIDWYYSLANVPVIGWLFCHTLTLPAGLLQMRAGIEHVFHPNPVPKGYMDRAAIPLVLRPRNFLNNARDVANLLDYVERIHPLYSTIAVPTVIITGDSDDIVYEEIHSRGLKRDIPGAELVTVKGLGHKPDYIVTDLAIAAIEKIAGHASDLERARQLAEATIAQSGNRRT
ncbi:MAG: hypothetical protein RLZZ444_3707 [Pseudomonadota bacterium]